MESREALEKIAGAADRDGRCAAVMPVGGCDTCWMIAVEYLTDDDR